MSGDSTTDKFSSFTGSKDTLDQRQWFTPMIGPTTPPPVEIGNKMQPCESYSKNESVEGQINSSAWSSPNVSLPESGPSESNDENAGVQNFPSPKSLFKEEMRYDSIGEISTPTWSPTWSASPVSPSCISPTTTETLTKRDRAGSFWDTFNSLSTRNSKNSDNNRPRLASDVIQRFESTQSSSFKEYRYWKETKWGEDNLDEVEFEDEDVNLELAIPKLFSNPVISMPSLGDFNNMIDDVWSRAVAYIISLCGMAVSAKYYFRRPRELFVAAKSALALWLPHPPEWICNSCMSMVDNGIIQTTAKLLQSMPAFSGEDETEVDPLAFDEEDEEEEDDDDLLLAERRENRVGVPHTGLLPEDTSSLHQGNYLGRVYPFHITRVSVWDTVINVLLTALAAVVGFLSIMVVTFAMVLKLVYEKVYRGSGKGPSKYPAGVRAFISRLFALFTLTWLVPFVSLISNPFGDSVVRASSSNPIPGGSLQGDNKLQAAQLSRKRARDLLIQDSPSTPSTCTSVKSSRRSFKLPAFSFTEADFSVNRKSAVGSDSGRLVGGYSRVKGGADGTMAVACSARNPMSSWLVSHFMALRGKATLRGKAAPGSKQASCAGIADD